MNGYHSYVQEQSSRDVLQELIEIFASKGWLNKNLKIKYQHRRYRISCSEERFFAYQINESCGFAPGVPGWPVCIIKEDYIYDELEDCTYSNIDNLNNKYKITVKRLCKLIVKILNVV